MGVGDGSATASDSRLPDEPVSGSFGAVQRIWSSGSSRVLARSDPDPHVAAAFALGWDMAEFYRHIRSGGGVRQPQASDILPGGGTLGGAEWTDIRLARVEVVLAKLSEPLGPLRQELNLQRLERASRQDTDPETIRKAVLSFHLALLGGLAAADYRLEKAYEIGRALADTCRSPTSGQELRQMLAPRRALLPAEWLLQLSSAFPPYAAVSVAYSLRSWINWASQTDAPHDSELALMRGTAATWRALLAGDTYARDLLGRPNLYDLNRRLYRETRGMVAQLLRVYWIVVLLALLLLSGSVLLIVEVNSSASAIAGVAGVVSSLGISAKGISVAGEVRDALFDQQVAVTVADAITLLPPTLR